MIDNITLVRGKHSYKAGIDAQFVSDERVRGERFFYTFPTSDAYLAANSGAAPFGYTSLQQDFGNLTAGYDSAFYGFFVQDDWQLNSRMKLLYGLRYDIFDVPSAREFAPIRTRRTSPSTKTTSRRGSASRGRSTIGRRPCCERRWA